MELHGREAERAAIAALLERAHEGRSGELLISGAAGIGKTALLADAAERADGLRVLRASGAEAEAELPFAGLHQLLAPVLDLAAGLPGPQAAALERALGVAGGAAPEPLLLGAGALGLLAEAAPALVLVDDLQWLDPASVAALGFAVRRLEAEGIAVLLAARDDLAPTGLPECRLGPLDREAAAAMLSGHDLAPAVRAQLLDAAAGNPLALVELPAALAPAQCAGQVPLDAVLPVPARLEAVYAARLARLSPATRELLVLAAVAAGDETAPVFAAAAGVSAAGDGGRRRSAPVPRASAAGDRERRRSAPVLRASAAGDGAGPGAGAALGEAEDAGLLALRGGRLVWRHPLVRAAVVRAAGEPAVRAAHAALARTSPADAAARCHAATVQPDAEVAAALALAGERAGARAAHAAKARALARAAELTPAAPEREARLVAAADAAWTAGRAEEALGHLAAAGTPGDPALRAEAGRIRGSVALHRGSPAAARRELEEAARLLAPHDPVAALRLAVAAMEAASLAGEATLPDTPAAPDGAEAAFLTDLSTAVRRLFAGDAAGAVPRLRAVVDAGGRLTDPQLVVWAGAAAFFWGDEVAAIALHERAATLARAAGHAVVLAFALTFLATADAWAGRLADAEARGRDALALAQEAGLANTEAQVQATLAQVLALRGEAGTSRRLAEAARAAATDRGLVLAEGAATLAMAELELAAGDPDAAFERLDELVHGPGAHPAHRFAPVPVLVEAAARAGRAGEARPAAERFAGWADAVGTAWAAPLAARSLALVADGEEADARFMEAMRLHDRHRRPLDRARTALLLGERLRRARRKAEARGPLRTALEDFERAGARPWADRARDELRAAGSSPPRAGGRPLDRLTPQERQVARLVAGGASNRDAAAALFLSPRTVEYHLHKVFRKLGVHGRTELAALLTGEHGG